MVLNITLKHLALLRKKMNNLTGFSYYSEVTINNLVVRKGYRGKSIGIKLIKKTEEYFKNKGFNNINLVTKFWIFLLSL